MSSMPDASSPRNLGYYRFPALFKNTLVFTAEGDLWKKDISQPYAYRLTTHHGVEKHAHISPDGKWVAFTGNYDGMSEVYCIPLQGGLPKRLSYHGYTKVVGWTAEGKVIFSTEKFSTLPNEQLALVDIQSLEIEVMPLHQASEGCFDESGQTLFFTRLPFQGSHTKRYQGGSVETIWKFTKGEKEAVPLTNSYKGTSKTPILYKKRIYFLSDRDGTMNIWSMTQNGKGLRQHTHSKGWDLKGLNFWEGKFVYQKGADIYMWDAGSKEEKLIEIYLSSDFEQRRKKWEKNPIRRLTHLHLSPTGTQLALTTRGRVFVAPVYQGRMKEITRKQGVRYRDAQFLDEKTLCMFSDESGEVEIWESPADQPDQHSQLTKNSSALIMGQQIDPQGDKIAYHTKDWQLWIFSRSSKTKVLVDTSFYRSFGTYRWSPDGKWLCYTKVEENLNKFLVLYQPSSQKRISITTERLDSFLPRWSPNGKWLYFISDREFRPIVKSPWGPRQPEPFYDRTQKIYALALNEEERFPFQEYDELAPRNSEKKNSKKNGEKNSPQTVKIDLKGLPRRLYEVPIKARNFVNIEIAQEYIYWLEWPSRNSYEYNLYCQKIGNDPSQNPIKVAADVDSFMLSANKKKILIYHSDSLYIFDADGKAANLNKSSIDLGRWQFQLDPMEEWRQMFVDAWRLERDYFYDKNLHGLDWKAELEKHLPLVERVSDRDELDDLMAHMVSELSALHIFVSGGDKRRGRTYNAPAQLGALLKRRASDHSYEISHIFQTDPDYPNELSPLARPEVNAQVGDCIEAIDGVPVKEVSHISELLMHKAYKQVRLTLQAKEDKEGTREVIVKPINIWDDYRLRYEEWAFTRRKEVEEMGKGKIGYVHLKAMSGQNYTEWIRQFYPVFHLPGLIIDVRHNRGGNIDSWILGKLLRKAWAFFQPRTGNATWGMQYAFRGHMVVICNENTASDGESFSEGFRRLGLGKVIGKRTWGGNIWLTRGNRLVDRGIATAAEIGVYSPEGEWLIEGYGVDPDIEVDNLPHETFLGKDRQLETAVAHILELLEKDPRDIPPAPPYPNKRFSY